MSKTELSDKQKRFVEEYCIDLNAVQAYIRAGYASKHAAKAASTLLGDIRIRKAVAERQAGIAKKHDITLTELITLHRNNMAGNMLDFSEWTADRLNVKPSDQLTREQGARIKAISETVNQAGFRSVKIELHDPIRSAECMAKLAGLNIERRELSGIGGKPIEHKIEEPNLENLDDKELLQLKALRLKMESKKEDKKAA
jgi:phage terminase small subunit